MKKKIWRLSSAPTVEDLKTAIEARIITKEEAKEMLLREEDDIPKDPLKEVKDEIKLLRDIVLKLSSQPLLIPYVYPTIIERIIEKPHYAPYIPYMTWCGSSSDSLNKANVSYSMQNCGGVNLPTIDSITIS